MGDLAAKRHKTDIKGSYEFLSWIEFRSDRCSYQVLALPSPLIFPIFVCLCVLSRPNPRLKSLIPVYLTESKPLFSKVLRRF